MSLRADLERRVEKKRGENVSLDGQISELQAQKRANDAVIQELLSVLKSLPKDGETDSPAQAAEKTLRRGSDVYNAREVLRGLRANAHIDVILNKMSKPATKENRRSLASQMSWYAKRNLHFTKPESNIFGLREWGEAGENKVGEAGQATQPDALPLVESEKAH